MDTTIVKRFAAFCTLAASAALSGCDRGGDDPPPPPAPAVAIAANPAAVQLGAGSVLAWSSTNALTCSATGSWTGAKATSGTESVTPSAAGTASYTLTCTGAGGSANSVATVTVSVPLPTAVLTSASSTAIAGNSTTLTWSSTDATGCTASGAWNGAKSASGTETVTLAAVGSANFTLTCTGPGGDVVASATVNAINGLNFLLTTNENGNVSVFTRDSATGVPTQVGGSPFPAGGRPRDVVLHVNNRFAYVTNSSTLGLSAYRVDETTGVLTAIPGSPYELDFTPGDLAMHPAGTFLYVATLDGLFTYAVNPTSGALTKSGLRPQDTTARLLFIRPEALRMRLAPVRPAALGPSLSMRSTATVRSRRLLAVRSRERAGAVAVTIDPTGEFAYVANMSFDAPGRVSAYSINATTGALTPVAGSPFATLTGPTKIVIDPQGVFLYVACNGGPTHFGGLLGFSINRSTGALTPLSGSPFSPADPLLHGHRHRQLRQVHV